MLQRAFARKMQLRRQLSNLSKEPTESLTQYTARGMSLQNTLAAIGMQVAETELCWNILNGPPEEFIMIAALLKNSNQACQRSV